MKKTKKTTNDTAEERLNKRCREGRLACPSCGQMMQMYYRPQCFHCTKPQPKLVLVQELLPALYYIENQGHAGFKDRIFSNYEMLFLSELRNDTYSSMIVLAASDRSDEDPEIVELYDTFKAFYPEPDIVWFTSW